MSGSWRTRLYWQLTNQGNYHHLDLREHYLQCSVDVLHRQTRLADGTQKNTKMTEHQVHWATEQICMSNSMEIYLCYQISFDRPSRITRVVIPCRNGSILWLPAISFQSPRLGCKRYRDQRSKTHVYPWAVDCRHREELRWDRFKRFWAVLKTFLRWLLFLHRKVETSIQISNKKTRQGPLRNCPFSHTEFCFLPHNMPKFDIRSRLSEISVPTARRPL